MRPCLAGFLVLLTFALVGGGAPSTSAEELPPSSRVAPVAITVATFNVMSARTGVAWEPRRTRVLRLLERAKADVVVLQEADRSPTWDTHHPDRVPARKLPALWLARKAGLALAFSGSSMYVERPKGVWLNNAGPHVMYNPRRLTQLGDWSDQSMTSGGGFQTLRDRRTGRLIRIAALHLSPSPRPEKIQQHLRFLDYIDESTARSRTDEPHNLPTIWAGDFNTTDPALVRAMRRRGLVDTVKVAKKRTHHRINTFKGRSGTVRRDGVRIDQIWVSAAARVDSWTQVVDVENHRYAGPFASDHNPVVARVVLPG